MPVTTLGPVGGKAQFGSMSVPIPSAISRSNSGHLAGAAEAVRALRTPASKVTRAATAKSAPTELCAPAHLDTRAG